MNYAVITDVHGNAPALRAVLNAVDTVGTIDHIFCLGDMIAIGPDTNEVLELLFGRSDVSMVTGNHDEAVLALINGRQHPASHAHVKEHHQWIADRLDPVFVPLLEKLPRSIRHQIEGKWLYFSHYAMDKKKADHPIGADPFLPIEDPALANLEKLFDGHPADLISFGHHHPLHFFRNEKTAFLNPGALGCSPKPSAPYALVSIKEGKMEIGLYEAAYDNAAFLHSYQELGVPESEFILEVFHGGQLNGMVPDNEKRD